MNRIPLKRKGVALIVVLGVLAILALLATTFASLARLDRVTSRNYLDGVRARLVARSGIDHAIQRLSTMGVDPGLGTGGEFPMAFWGDDVTETVETLSPLQVSLREAVNPSFALEVDGDPFLGSPQPVSMQIEGKPCGLTDTMLSGTYGLSGDNYSLCVTDASSKIWINAGVEEAHRENSSGSRNLMRMLNRLGNLSDVNIPGLGDIVLANRPPQGYTSLEELVPHVGRDGVERLSHLLTTRSWTESVPNPVPYTERQANQTESEFGVRYWRGGAYRFGRGKDYLGNEISAGLDVYSSTDDAGNPAADGLGHAVYAMDELFPGWIEITERAPVNLNTARREVLVALLCDLHGVFLSDRRRNNLGGSVWDSGRMYGGGYQSMWVYHSYSPDGMSGNAGEGTPRQFWKNGAWTDFHRYARTMENDWKDRFQGSDGDEVGFLYETLPIQPPPSGGTSSFEPNRADVIADEIIACRRKNPSPHGRVLAPSDPGFVPSYSDPGVPERTGYTDYGTAPFGGRFRTWRQFNEFCDNLVRIGILEDSRPLFFDHSPQDAVNQRNYVTGEDDDPDYSRHQASVACQAMADVLKANFNPNLHLNEANPDRNLFLYVDKTDLVVNSTEFCFLSTGYFDIRSVGRILSPLTGNDCRAGDNRIMAETEIHAGVKIFDMVRQSSQGAFSKGTVSGCSCTGSTASGGMSIDIGPEPGVGEAVGDNDWSGYLALPTLNGPVGNGETIRAHFERSCEADYHVSGKVQDLGSVEVANEAFRNVADPGETVSGPYDVTDGADAPDGQRFRLARSFSLLGFSGTGSLPSLTTFAPLDQRKDGMYSERHSGIAYWIDPATVTSASGAGGAEGDFQGSFAFWYKPSYFPEQTGKPRMLCNMDPVWTPAWVVANPFSPSGQSHWKCFFTPSHHYLPSEYASGVDGSGDAVTIHSEFGAQWGEVETYSGTYKFNSDWKCDLMKHGVVPFRPVSFIFGAGYGRWYNEIIQNYQSDDPKPEMDMLKFYQIYTTNTLNHLWHHHSGFSPDDPAYFSPFKGHEWIHVTGLWREGHDSVADDGDNPNWTQTDYFQNGEDSFRLIINGEWVGNPLAMLETGSYVGGTVQQDNPFPGASWFTHRDGNQNALRFGSTTEIFGEPTIIQHFNVKHHYNYAADGTFDEVYVYPLRNPDVAGFFAPMGRYHLPLGGNEGRFVSDNLESSPCQHRSLAPPALSSVPTGGASVPASNVPPTGGISSLLGVSWTLLADNTAPAPDGWTREPVVRDWSGGEHCVPGVADLLTPVVEVSIESESGAMAVRDEEYSVLTGSSGGYLPITTGDRTFQYSVDMSVEGAGLNTRLRSTPVLDDITFYTHCGHVHYTYYYQLSSSL